MPEVCVVIVNWNSGALLGKCLSALQRQSYRDWRAVVVDNASSDRSLDAVTLQHPKVSILRLERNSGFAAANNLALFEDNDCKWIALLNPDAFPEPDWLENLVSTAQSQPGYAVFSSRLLMMSRPGTLDGAGDAYHVSGLVWRRGHGSPAQNRYEDSEEVFSACAAAALYRRDALLAIGGFDEDFFCYVEDVDLGFRLRLAGERCLYVPSAKAFHVGSATSGLRSPFSIYHGHRNLVWCYVKNMPALLFWLYLPQHLLLNLISLIWFSLRGQPATIFRAKWDALTELPKMWRKRRTIQAARKVCAREIRRMLTGGLPRSS